jgi:hypothetical protein
MTGFDETAALRRIAELGQAAAARVAGEKEGAALMALLEQDVAAASVATAVEVVVWSRGATPAAPP